MPRSATLGCALLFTALTACRSTPQHLAEVGRDLYRQNGCASCHGAEGRGDGRVGESLARRPRDLTDAAAFTHGSDVDSIVNTLASGVAAPHDPRLPASVQHHTLVMPRFDHLSEDDRRALALHVISLRRSAGTERTHP